MASSVIKRMTSNYETILNGASVSSGNTSLYNGRSLSTYSLIQLTWYVNYLVRASAIVPRSTFTNGINVELFYVDSQNTQRWADVKYVNDTTVNLSCSSNATGNITAVGII